MAKLHHFFLLLLFFLATTPSLADDQNDVDLLLQSQKTVRRPLREKLSHLRFYWHDVFSGPNTSAVVVVPPLSNTTGFGSVTMIDDPLTLGPELSSKLVGRAQGFYAGTSKEASNIAELALLMSMNFVFEDGKYNGSTVAILGRNAPFSGVREMPIVGGSGLFRLARGYVQASTHTLDQKTGYTVVEYNVFVMHY